MDTLATNRQVAHDDLPTGGLGQFSFDPCPLGRGLPLGLGAKIPRIPPRAQRAGIEDDYADILAGKMVRVVKGWHDPAALGLSRVIDLSLRRVFVVMVVVTERSNPWHLQRWRGVDLLKRRRPARVRDRLHATRIEVIARRHDT